MPHLLPLTLALTLALPAHAADPPEETRRKPRPVALAIGATLLTGAGTSFAFSQIERGKWNRQGEAFRSDPLSLPWSDEERARLKQSDATLRRHYMFSQIATGLGVAGAGFVVYGTFGKRSSAASSGPDCPIRPGASPAHLDEDGCPMVLGSLAVLATVEGEPREGLSLAVIGEGDSRTLVSGAERITVPDLMPGSYEVRSLEPFWDGATSLKIKTGMHKVDVPVFEIIPGTLVVTARDDAGNAIRDAVATVAPRGGGDGQTVSLDESGYGEAMVAPGSWSIFIEAPGYGVRRTDAEVESKEKTEVITTLRPAMAELSGARIELKEKVFFTAGRDEVDERSFEMLDEVANVLLRRSDIILLEIQGHTSSEGGYELNQQLSERRAHEVQAYLEKQGIPKSRMKAVGYGPSKPLVPEKTEADRALNRRVELVILHTRK